MRQIRSAIVALGLAVGLVACDGKSNNDVCIDACDQLNACQTFLESDADDGGAGDDITDCSTACGAGWTCQNPSSYDACVEGVDTSNSSCQTDLQACSTTNC